SSRASRSRGRSTSRETSRSLSWPPPRATRSRACSARTSGSCSALEMPGAFTGYYLDGRSATRREASIRLAASGLESAFGDGTRLWWPLKEVRQTQSAYAGKQIRLERGAPFPEILLLDDSTFLAALHATAPEFGRRFHNPGWRRSRVLLTVGAALASIAVGAVLYAWG